MNAHRRRLDVWLVHRCERCDETWNATVAERVAPEEIDLRAYEGNDPETARRCAFAVPGADRAVAVTVERPPVAAEVLSIRMILADAVSVRLDRLLARELGLPRALLAGMKGKVKDGQTVAVTCPRRRADPWDRTSG